MTKPISVTRGSGNVFKDIGLPNPEERFLKAQLTREIGTIIRDGALTQREAAEILGIDQPKVSYLLNGRLAGFSTDRLLGFLVSLGRDVEIVLKKPPRSRKHGRLRVIAA